jgi:6-phosphogluconolactonase
MDHALMIQIHPNAEALSRAAAEEIARMIEARAEGEFTIALAGGSTPRTLYRILATDYRERIPWERLRFFMGDERYVSSDSPQSNYRMAREAMLDQLDIPADRIHPMPTDRIDPEEAAAAYEKTLREQFGDELPRFDLILLGIGTDGHTASLFPGSPALDERERWAVVSYSPVEPTTRLTLTPPVLENARRLIFLVAGKEKRDVMENITQFPDRARVLYPSAMIGLRENAVWYVEKDAVRDA